MTDMMQEPLFSLLDTALANRADLITQLAAEQTNTYRLFHGSIEGVPGLTIDRYNDLILIQTFHRALSIEQYAEIEAFYARTYPACALVYNDRSHGHSRVMNRLTEAEEIIAYEPRIAQELGVNYRIQGRHNGQDPWLFLDLRAGRRRVMQEAAGKSVLNLFAYTCGVGIAAAKAGARHVVNIDFAESSLLVGKDNAKLNDLPIRVRFVQSDAFAALNQLSGKGQATMVRGKRMPTFPKLEKQQFDLVMLDPPRFSKSPFGVVDLVNDYASVFKPALLSTNEGGTLICCNNVAQVSRDAWLDQLERSAAKAGRPISSMEWIKPDSDFPTSDGQHPLKIALLRV
ncbi:class I SAM-dependent rRNA methyltransferase [Deefgea salmonis]|uniref:Class I SAM-dependent methyltransferase n=1 Tax=Deefgea salmonis TaxID=2875502 RepID=A0ABS8BMN9_9NEIS|nr:class I SAM-dependent methyltransferase [Deefgea salmonis]MCB5196990.1 class I SAM-dependent methyltransferase [Deefgea salmonis]